MIVSWVVEYGVPSDDYINVSCKLNEGTPEEQNCDPYPYYGPPGGGGCEFSPPNYILVRDGAELRTVINTLNCTACNSTNPTDCSNKNAEFYPLSFEVIMPNNITCIVGEKQNLGITTTNKGMLTDSYSVNVVSQNPGWLLVEDGSQTTQPLDTNDVEKLYVGLTLLTSEETGIAGTTVNSTINSTISFNQLVNVKGSDKSLPDFGLFGIFQIMFAAAVLVSFLFLR